MYSMFRSLLALGLVFVVSQTVRADLFMTITPSETSVTAGTIINLTLEIESNTNVSIGGIDLLLLAGAGDGSSGTFVAANSVFFAAPNSPHTDWDLATPGQAFYARNVIGVAPIVVGGVSLSANTKRTFATIQLDTAGVATGTYDVAFDSGSFSALTPTNQNITISGTGTSFTIITAVPEPSSIFLMLPALVAVFARRRREY